MHPFLEQLAYPIDRSCKILEARRIRDDVGLCYLEVDDVTPLPLESQRPIQNLHDLKRAHQPHPRCESRLCAYLCHWPSIAAEGSILARWILRKWQPSAPHPMARVGP